MKQLDDDRDPRGDGDDAEDPVQIDFYGIRISARPREGEYGSPSSWPQVWDEIHADVRGIVRNLIGVLADTLQGVRNLVRGVGRIPAPYSHQVRSAHAIADEARSGTLSSAAVAIDQAQQDLERVCGKKILAGYKVRFYEDRGRIVALFLPTMSEPEAAAIARAILSSMPLTEDEVAPTNAEP